MVDNDLLIWPHVSVADLDALDAKQLELDSDIRRRQLEIEAGPPVPDNMGDMPAWIAKLQLDKARIASYRAEWIGWKVAWAGWKDAHYGEIARTGETVKVEYDAFVSSFNEFRRRLIEEFGGETNVKREVPAGERAALDVGGIGDAVLLLGLAGIGAFFLYKVTTK